MIEKRYFGKYDTTKIYQYIVTVDDFKVKFCEMGAAILSVVLKDSGGIERDVVLGFSKTENYMDNWPALGAVVGRYANRISQAKFSISGETFHLAENIPGGCLHSGDSYQFRPWQSETFEDEDGAHIVFYLESPHMDQGFPGNLKVKTEYVVGNDYSITINYEYESDKDTPVNLTNHTYFNLGGHDSGSVEGHKLMILADKVTQIDERQMPTGNLLDITGSAFDFRMPTVIKENASKSFESYCVGQGYDINYVLLGEEGEYRQVAAVENEWTGISMKVFTDMPGLQFYVADCIADIQGKEGVCYEKKSGFCLETQFFPDAINIENFPSPVIKAGELKKTTTKYKFHIIAKEQTIEKV